MHNINFVPFRKQITVYLIFFNIYSKKSNMDVKNLSKVFQKYNQYKKSYMCIKIMYKVYKKVKPYLGKKKEKS